MVAMQKLKGWRNYLYRFSDLLDADDVQTIKKALDIVSDNNIHVTLHYKAGIFSAYCNDYQNIAADMDVLDFRNGKQFTERFMDAVRGFDSFKWAKKHCEFLKNTQATWKGDVLTVGSVPFSEVMKDVWTRCEDSKYRFFHVASLLCNKFSLDELKCLGDAEKMEQKRIFVDELDKYEKGLSVKDKRSLYNVASVLIDNGVYSVVQPADNGFSLECFDVFDHDSKVMIFDVSNGICVFDALRDTVDVLDKSSFSYHRFLRAIDSVDNALHSDKSHEETVEVDVSSFAKVKNAVIGYFQGK